MSVLEPSLAAGEPSNVPKQCLALPLIMPGVCARWLGSVVRYSSAVRAVGTVVRVTGAMRAVRPTVIGCAGTMRVVGAYAGGEKAMSMRVSVIFGRSSEDGYWSQGGNKEGEESREMHDGCC